MTLVDRSGNREGEQRRRVATGPGERLAGTREVRQMGVSVIHHPCTGIRVDGNGDGVVESPGGKAPAAGNGLAGAIEHADTIPGKTRIGLVGNPRVAIRIHRKAIRGAQPETGDSLRQQRIPQGGKQGSSVEVTCHPNIARAVNPKARWRSHPAAGVIHKQRPVGWRRREHRAKGGVAG